MARKRSTRGNADAGTEDKTGYSLDPLRGRVDRVRQLVDWMTAAFEHRDEFPPAVVITVVGDYLAQYDAVVDDLRSSATETSAERKRLAETAAALEDASRELEAAVDELKLRHVIGELSKDEFNKREADARAESETDELPAIREAIDEVDSVLAEVGAVQARIAEMRRNHAAIAAGGPPPAPVAVIAPAVFVAAPAALVAAPVVAVAPSLAPSGPVTARGTQPPPVAEADEEEPPSAAAEDELGEAAYNAGGRDEEWEVGTGGGRASEPRADGSGSSAEDLMATGVITARPDIATLGSIPAPPPPAQIGAVDKTEGEGPRLFVVAPEVPEKLYPFNGEVMSMGRGRNNDIQIKNDGKISRYHCRIFRRGDEFIIEDNKSSNGTLVNGKLVTRQRLDGGEQVQIGETRMTFYL